MKVLTLARRKLSHLISSSSRSISQSSRLRSSSDNAAQRWWTVSFPSMDHLSSLNPEPSFSKQKPGTVEPSYGSSAYGYNTFDHEAPFQVSITDNPNKGVLPSLRIAYEVWGELNANADNVILIHTGMSASSHAKSHESNSEVGWWERFIGPGRAIDTSKFFVICTNSIGSCFGSTGPSSINPETKKPYGTSFPIILIQDIVKAQFLLLDHLGIKTIHACVGASMGGMQSLIAAVLFPERVKSVVSISGSFHSHPTAIALRYLQRRILMSDPNWKNGHYYDSRPPLIGLKFARELATVTYRSGPEWEQRFGRQHIDNSQHGFHPQFQIEAYLNHQGNKSTLKYDPNSLLYLSKAMDLCDVSYGFDSLETAVKRIACPALVIGVQSDILFPISQQRQIEEMLKKTGNENVAYYELNSIFGHDTFLIDVVGVGGAIRGHLEHVKWHYAV